MVTSTLWVAGSRASWAVCLNYLPIVVAGRALVGGLDPSGWAAWQSTSNEGQRQEGFFCVCSGLHQIDLQR